MKHYLIFFSLLISFMISIEAQTTNQISIINLAVILLDEPDIEKMGETCRYYNLSEMEKENGFSVFQHPDGSNIRFKIQENENERKPLIEVITRYNSKNLKKILSELDFKKSGKEYVKGSKFAIKYSSCIIIPGNPSKVIFSKERVVD